MSNEPVLLSVEEFSAALNITVLALDAGSSSAGLRPSS
jgi:hypothetical protein